MPIIIQSLSIALSLSIENDFVCRECIRLMSCSTHYVLAEVTIQDLTLDKLYNCIYRLISIIKLQRLSQNVQLKNCPKTDATNVNVKRGFWLSNYSQQTVSLILVSGKTCIL